MSVRFPLNLEALGATAAVQLAVSSVVMLSTSVCQSPGVSCSPAIYPVLQAYSTSADLLHRLFLIDALRHWTAWLVFSGSKWTPATIPDSVTAEAGTLNPVLGYRTLAEVNPNYRIQQDNFASLHSLVAYVSELNQQLSPGQSVVTSRDGKAELQIVQQDTSATVFSITLPSGGNTTSTYQVGSNQGIFWIKEINGINVERYHQVAWSEPKEGSRTTCLTVQLIAPEKSNESGLPIELTVPPWLTHRLLAASSAKAAGEFSRLFLNWYWSAYLMSEPVKASMAAGYQGADLSSQVSVVSACHSGSRYCPGGLAMQTFSAGVVPQSYMMDAPAAGDTFSGSEEKLTVNNPDKKEPDHSGADEGKKPEGGDDEGDKGGGASFSDKPPLSGVTSPKSLLWQATEHFFLKHDGTVDQSTISLDDAYDLIRKFSHAGMLQILPVDGKSNNLWPMVVSKRLAHYIERSLNPEGYTEPSVAPGQRPDDRYVVPMTQDMFNYILGNFDGCKQFAETNINLRDKLKLIIGNFCAEQNADRCFYGGESVKQYILENKYGYQPAFEDNQPVADDIDVLLSYSDPEVLYQYLKEKLVDFEVQKPTTVLLFTFPGLKPKDQPYELHRFDFEFKKSMDGAENYYLPKLDVGMTLDGSQATFQSDVLVVSETIKRGLKSEVDMHGTVDLKNSKYVDRALILSAVFPRNHLFKFLLNEVMHEAKGIKQTVDELSEASYSEDTHFNIIQEQLIRRINSLKKGISEKEYQLAFYKDQLETFQLKLTQEQQKLADAEREYNLELHEQKGLLDAKNEKIEESVVETNHLKTKISKLEKACKSLKEQIVKIGAINRKLRGEMELVTKNAAVDKDKVKKLDDQLASLSNRLKESNDEVLRLNDEVLRLNGEVLGLKDDKKLHASIKEFEELMQKLTENPDKDDKDDKEMVKYKTVTGVLTPTFIVRERRNANDDLWNHGRRVMIAGTFTAGFVTQKFLWQKPSNNNGIKSADNDDTGSPCLNQKDYTGLNNDILGILCHYPKNYRIVDYQAYSSSLEKGIFNPLNSEILSKDKRSQEIRQKRKILLAHSGHRLFRQMTTAQLLRIMGGIRTGWSWINNSLPLDKVVTGIVNYCGLMPDKKWQYDCGREAALKMSAKQFQNEHFVIVNGRRDIRLRESDRFISFLPVWNITSGQLGYYDVWPYRLDRKGYTILPGTSKTARPFRSLKCNYKGFKKIQIKVFSHYKWVDTNASCAEADTIIRTNTDSVYWWSHASGKHYNTATCRDENRQLIGVWQSHTYTP
ncbi:hypothetical protein GZ77_21620 [Endozoicomonas montiporae]|uniref:Uncharacterized protein n=1 Tax=Endozoicomonas montiporae TaxID=1027273 RepID=A0A081N3J7_9GAMM|nr:hypothetical protein GZ77_21620 [Endozoicomonas montiporae]